MHFYLHKALARFRSSSQKLGIEVGRHHNINRADRICTFYYNHSNSMHVEDEFHVFFICPKFDELRENFLSPWYRQGDSRPVFFRLMKETNPDIYHENVCIHK